MNSSLMDPVEYLRLLKQMREEIAKELCAERIVQGNVYGEIVRISDFDERVEFMVNGKRFSTSLRSAREAALISQVPYAAQASAVRIIQEQIAYTLANEIVTKLSVLS